MATYREYSAAGNVIVGERFDSHLVHQTFIPSLNRPQAESGCGYAGSNKAFSVERDSVRKEQLLEPLALFERRLRPQVGGARQNALCERQAKCR